MTSRVAAVALAVAVLAPGEARADDDGGADDQAFWERALDPHGDEISDLVDRAQELAGQDDTAAGERARKLLEKAIEIDPDAPRPRWAIAQLHRRAAQPEACARHLAHAARVEPTYQPPGSVRDAPLLVDLTLAGCLGASGDFSAAADRLRRILARGLTGEARVYGLLAQVEMARGHVDAATFALERARRLRPHSSRFRFALALVYDRAARPAAARDELRKALARDPRLRSIRSPAGLFVPAADEHYLLGLAYREQSELHRAAIHLRHYLDETPVPLWDDRAREHLDAILDEGLPLAIAISGSATYDEDAAHRALSAARVDLERCVRDTPGALLRARITTFVDGTRDPGRGDAPRPGPRVLVDHEFATAKDALEEAIACAEGILRELDLPRPRGNPGQHATLEVPLLAP